MSSPDVQAPIIQQQTDECIFLIGRPPFAEYLGFLTTQTLQGATTDYGPLATEWRAANDHIHDLEQQEAGWADNPTIGVLAPNLEPLWEQVRADSLFQRSFSIVPTSIGIVELDRLVVYQKLINLEHVRRLHHQLGDALSDEEVFRLCLPNEHVEPAVSRMRIANNAYLFVSPSNDLRFLEPTLLDATQITGVSPSGLISNMVGLAVGFGANYLNVIHAENRLVLNNGSHRAFALREMGITHVPCLIQHVSRREELKVMASSDLQQQPDTFLTDPRPPLLKDYFDPKLRKVVATPRRLRQVKITFAIEQLDIPAVQ